jgi:hypothetical protein
MYIPIGQLSPVSLKKIRVVHVLDGYDKTDTVGFRYWTLLRPARQEKEEANDKSRAH